MAIRLFTSLAATDTFSDIPNSCQFPGNKRRRQPRKPHGWLLRAAEVSELESFHFLHVCPLPTKQWYWKSNFRLGKLHSNPIWKWVLVLNMYGESDKYLFGGLCFRPWRLSRIAKDGPTARPGRFWIDQRNVKWNIQHSLVLFCKSDLWLAPELPQVTPKTPHDHELMSNACQKHVKQIF